VTATLLLTRADVEQDLTPPACSAAVEDAFRQHALGTVSAKINANFPANADCRRSRGP